MWNTERDEKTGDATHGMTNGDLPHSDEVPVARPTQIPNGNESHDPEGDNASKLTSKKAREIRKQIDYYFSADNLKRDNFLLRKMNGSKNRPVPAIIIADFGKMKQYKPLGRILESLATSKTVNIVQKDGETCLQRKEPYHRPDAANAAGVPRAKSSAATGFEPYFADAPVTPAAAQEESDLYSLDRAVTDRIEIALGRFQTRRKMHSFAKNVFDKWLIYGGVDSSPLPFASGPTPEEMQGMTAKEKKAAAAHVTVLADQVDQNGEPKWEVDFVGVTKSFLSRTLLEIVDLDSEERIFEATNIIENFYRYLNHHDACPEHRNEINDARQVCKIATQELRDTRILKRRLPGAFNVACSKLFGGAQRDSHAIYANSQEWLKSREDKVEAFSPDTEAKQVFMTGMVALDFDKNEADMLQQKTIKIERNIGLEVVTIDSPLAETTELYEALNAGYAPLGKTTCRPWTPPDFAEYDLPTIEPSESEANKTYTIYLESTLLELFTKGTKMEATVCTLECGLQWLDETPGVYCSFYMILENELIKGWKEPRWFTHEELVQREAARADKNIPAEEEEDGDMD